MTRASVIASKTPMQFGGTRISSQSAAGVLRRSARSNRRHRRAMAARHAFLGVGGCRLRALGRGGSQWSRDDDEHQSALGEWVQRRRAIFVGAVTRLRPAVMTALVASQRSAATRARIIAGNGMAVRNEGLEIRARSKAGRIFNLDGAAKCFGRNQWSPTQ